MTTTTKKLGVTVTSILLIAVLCLTLTGCGHTLSGKYKSRSGNYEISFEKDGSCVWYQDGSFFEGTYSWDDTDKVYILDIKGNGLYSNTSFTAEPYDEFLTVNGGIVYNEVFVKK